jgi:hypothetical protein
VATPRYWHKHKALRPDMLAGLVHDGLATATPETVETGGRPIEVVRITITDAGRRALED